MIHTPGPVTRPCCSSTSNKSHAEGCLHIAQEERDKLYAAAPDLLAALHAIKIIADENLMGITNQRIQNILRAAIAKAEGSNI